MLEILMAVCLTVMGIYFFKSTDLPKELTDRSNQMRSDVRSNSTPNFSFPSSNIPPVSIPKEIDFEQLAKINKIKKEVESRINNEAIDKLTLTIIGLEQEISSNKARNNEIQILIDAHLINLQLLQNKLS